MLRDNLVGLIEPILSKRGSLSSRACAPPTRNSHRTIDPLCLENPRPEGAESTLTENVASPFHAEPRQVLPRKARGEEHTTSDAPILITKEQHGGPVITQLVWPRGSASVTCQLLVTAEERPANDSFQQLR